MYHVVAGKLCYNEDIRYLYHVVAGKKYSNEDTLYLYYVGVGKVLYTEDCMHAVAGKIHYKDDYICSIRKSILL